MRTPLVVAAFGAIVVALTTSVAPSRAQSAAVLYPYCAFRSGSTSCYHLTLESCGRSCIRNPGYVGDERARVLRAALGAPAPAAEPMRMRSRAEARRRTSIDSLARATGAGARASAAVADDFAGYPTSDLINRFGDHQAQGRF